MKTPWARDRGLELWLAISIVATGGVLALPVAAQISTRMAQGDSITKLHQVGEAFALYQNDYDEELPTGNRCEPGSSLNPDLRAAWTDGCVHGAFDRVNEEYWQKWLLPYTPFETFLNPLRPREEFAWRDRGILADGYVINLSLLGLPAATSASGSRFPKLASWIGANPASTPEAENAFLVLDLPLFSTVTPTLMGPYPSQVLYPRAVREELRYALSEGSLRDCMMGIAPGPTDYRKAPFGSVPFLTLSGRAGCIPVERLLAETPSRSDWGLIGEMERSSDRCNWIRPDLKKVRRMAHLHLPTQFPRWGLGH